MKALLPLVATLVALTGCALSPPESPAPEPLPKPDLPPITYDAETLGNLLVAEDAVQRQALPLALAYYDKAARATGDPRVLEEAASLATYLGRPQKARELTALWLKREPHNEQALRIAALADINLGDSSAASAHIDRLIAAHGSKALQPLVAEARNLDEQSSRDLLSALSGLADRYPDEAALWYARALDERQRGNLDAALAAVDQVLDERPDHVNAQLLKGQLMFEQGDASAARRYLRGRVDEHPESRRTRIAYIRLLLATDDTEEAQTQIRALAERNPDDPDLQYSLALIALDSGATDTAEALLNTLLEQRYRTNEVLLRLGQSAEMRGDAQAAIGYYRRVRGVDQLQARLQAARLMYATGRSAAGHALMAQLANANPEQADALIVSEAAMRADSGDINGALALLNQSLDSAPDNIDLLYARAMTAAVLQHYTQMERDLTRILDIAPNDAAALNALGYTWADQGTHLEQARDMIQRALQQQPDNPAFLDSMGWVLYRLGRLDDAEQYLRRAHASYPDPEVAAHYGEVLWMNGKHGQARRVWQAGLATDPQSPAIHDTLNRLEIQL